MQENDMKKAKTCDTCRYINYCDIVSPCVDCIRDGGDDDMWEEQTEDQRKQNITRIAAGAVKMAREGKICALCRWVETKSDDLPCSECYRNSGYNDMWESNEEQPKIKDTSARREFATGAVRDIAEGKGRCDLLPLDVVASWMNDAVLCEIASFMQTHSVVYLRSALSHFCSRRYPDSGRADMMLDLAKHFEDGAKKYGEYNWQKGLPVHCYVDSGVRHYLKWFRGDSDEPHDRAFVWNIVCCIWTMMHKPECDDLPGRKVSDESVPQ